jgi:hypothetical protein
MDAEPPRRDADNQRAAREHGSSYRTLFERVSARLLLVWLTFVLVCAGIVVYWELTGWFDH